MSPGDDNPDRGGAVYMTKRGDTLAAQNISINRSNEHSCLESSNNHDIQTEKMVLSLLVKGKVKEWNGTWENPNSPSGRYFTRTWMCQRIPGG